MVRARSIQLRNTGATLSPFNAFLLLQGLETMAVRLERHEANARAVAAYLAADPRVEWVSFAGFPDHPYHHLVQRYLNGRVPSIITFGAAGGYEAGWPSSTRCSCSSACSTSGMPSRWPSTRRRPPTASSADDELMAAGIRPETIRLSIGLEHIDDLIEDIDQALPTATS